MPSILQRDADRKALLQSDTRCRRRYGVAIGQEYDKVFRSSSSKPSLESSNQMMVHEPYGIRYLFLQNSVRHRPRDRSHCELGFIVRRREHGSRLDIEEIDRAAEQ